MIVDATMPAVVQAYLRAALVDRAHMLQTAGKLRDALSALDAIRPGDPLQAQADELRTLLQRELLQNARRTAPPDAPAR